MISSLGTFAANQGSVRICNRGAYVARCYLEFRTNDGRTQVYETGKFPVGQCPTLELPFTSVWGRVWCDEYAFIAVTKRVFEQSFNTPATRCYDMTGTTLHPGWSGTGC